jgi:hypothetical protein
MFGKELQLNAAYYLRKVEITPDEWGMKALILLHMVRFSTSYMNFTQPHIIKQQI